MIYKLTSVKRVLAKVFTDLDLKEGDHRILDMIEWCAEGLLKIGAFPQFINKVTGKDNVPFLEVWDYQTQLPNDFHSAIQVSFSENVYGPYYPMIYGTGSFEFSKDINEVSSTMAIPESNLVSMAMTLYELSYTDALTKINNEPVTRANLTVMLNRMNPDASGAGGAGVSNIGASGKDYKYIITPGYIKTNIRTGFIMMAYQAIPTDSEGYPLIPDDVDFVEALYWYVTMKLLYPEWKLGRVRDEVYYDARRSWNFNCKKAYGNAMMPNTDQLETIKNQWLRLIPEIHEHSGGFATLGDRQIIYNKNK
jgi:hypothetical protein